MLNDLRTQQMLKKASFVAQRKYPHVNSDVFRFLKLVETIFAMDNNWKMSFEAYIDRSYNDIQKIEKRKGEYLIIAYAMVTYECTHNDTLDVHDIVLEIFGEHRLRKHLTGVYCCKTMLEIYFTDDFIDGTC